MLLCGVAVGCCLGVWLFGVLFVMLCDMLWRCWCCIALLLLFVFVVFVCGGVVVVRGVDCCWFVVVCLCL